VTHTLHTASPGLLKGLDGPNLHAMCIGSMPCSVSRHHLLTYHQAIKYCPRQLLLHFKHKCSLHPSSPTPSSSSKMQLYKPSRQGVHLLWCAGFTAEGFLWAALAPELAKAAGTCSYFNSSADSFQDNRATAAGAVLFSTDANSTAIYCQSTILPQDHEDCQEWGRTAPNTLGPVGYGPGLAFPAASILLDGNPDYNNTLPYISDGISKLALPIVTVLDQAKHIVVLPGLTANLTVLNNTTPGLASLPSQTQASGSNGSISFSSVVLVAVPGLWRLQVALSSYPGVGHKSAPCSSQQQCYWRFQGSQALKP